MANERVSSPNIPADNTGSKSNATDISEATAGAGSWQEQPELPREPSLDNDFFTPEEDLSKCPECRHERRPGGGKHYDDCPLRLVYPVNETSSSYNGPECVFGLLEKLHQPQPIFSDIPLIDRYPSTLAIDPSLLTISTATLADDSEDILGKGHSTDEQDSDPSSIQSSHLPHHTDIQLQPAVESGRLISNDVISLDEPRSHLSKCPECQEDITRFRPDTRKRHIDEHKPGAYPCPHPECKKSKDPFKRPDKLKRHLKTCRFERQLGEMRSSS